jgi:hypothetical protein
MSIRMLYVHLKRLYRRKEQKAVYLSVRDATNELGENKDKITLWYHEEMRTMPNPNMRPKKEQDLRQMETCLISVGNKATYSRWFEHVHDLTAVKENGKVIKDGMSQKTFDRRLKDLKGQGRVTANSEGQGASYSCVRLEEGTGAVVHEQVAVKLRQAELASIEELTRLVNDEPK